MMLRALTRQMSLILEFLGALLVLKFWKLTRRIKIDDKGEKCICLSYGRLIMGIIVQSNNQEYVHE